MAGKRVEGAGLARPRRSCQGHHRVAPGQGETLICVVGDRLGTSLHVIIDAPSAQIDRSVEISDLIGEVPASKGHQRSSSRARPSWSSGTRESGSSGRVSSCRERATGVADCVESGAVPS